MTRQAPSSAELTAVIDRFWETIPPLWHQTRAYIRQAATENFGITTEQFHALRRIRKGVDSVSALAEANATSRSSVSKAVDALVNKGLVARVPDERDRRHVHLSLTGEGEKLIAALYNQARQWMTERFKKLDTREMDAVLEAMSILKRAFHDAQQSGKK